MAIDQPFHGWEHEDMSHKDDSQEVSAPQMPDHGSISFGRFAYESLSWERRSVFTHNKCQEELEKFRSPGLVAKKKAYFEEYYKRIRAMKESQENQQTELTLDYGGDESISSQNEEAETTVQQAEQARDYGHDENTSSQNGGEIEANAQLERFGDGAANIVVGHSDEPSVEISMEKVKEILEVQNRHLDLKNANQNLGSLRSNSENLELEDNAKYPLQMQQLDTEISVNESLIKTIEVAEQDSFNNLDKEGDSRENGISIDHVEPEGPYTATKLYTSDSKLEDLELKLATKLVSGNIAPDIRNHKGRISVHKLKEPSGAGRNDLKFEDKTKYGSAKPSKGPDIVKQSRETKYGPQRATVKSGNFAGLRKTVADNVSRYSKSTSAPSQRRLTEVHSSVTLPRPFSLATDRRAGQSGSREGLQKSDPKTLNKRIPLAVRRKDIVNVQDSSKQTITISSMQTSGSEDKRGYKEKRKPLLVAKQHIGMKDRGRNVAEPVKPRSVDLPSHSKHNQNIGIDKRTKGGIRTCKQREEKGEVSLRGHRTGTEVVASPAGNLRSDTKKVVPSPVSGRKLRFGEQSPNEKQRQEKPNWR